MAILIGVDEAGYGPNYGPLCVAASAWRVGARADGGRGRAEGFAGDEGRAGSSPSPTAQACSTVRTKPRAARAGDPDLYKLLKKCVARSPDKAGRKIAIADSKALYSPQAGVRQIERGVLAALAAMRRNGDALADDAECVRRVAELLEAVACDPMRRRHELACHASDELELPLESAAAEICKLGRRLADVCQAGGVELVALRARLVYPAEFNALCEEHGTKGAALSHVTLGLVRQIVDSLPTAHGPLPTFIYLDKHGGRSRYAALVQHHFADCWVDVLAEARIESRYAWDHGGRRVEAAFRVGCEAMLPTALASMTAKYLRETSMRAFNAFWTTHVPGLRPTAGYPMDSGRFREAIATAQAELGIEDHVLWRSR